MAKHEMSEAFHKWLAYHKPIASLSLWEADCPPYVMEQVGPDTSRVALYWELDPDEAAGFDTQLDTNDDRVCLVLPAEPDFLVAGRFPQTPAAKVTKRDFAKIPKGCTFFIDAALIRKLWGDPGIEGSARQTMHKVLANYSEMRSVPVDVTVEGFELLLTLPDGGQFTLTVDSILNDPGLMWKKLDEVPYAEPTLAAIEKATTITVDNADELATTEFEKGLARQFAAMEGIIGTLNTKINALGLLALNSPYPQHVRDQLARVWELADMRLLVNQMASLQAGWSSDRPMPANQVRQLRSLMEFGDLSSEVAYKTEREFLQGCMTTTQMEALAFAKFEALFIPENQQDETGDEADSA